MEKQINPGKRSGIVIIPPSKSDAQRAYLSAALANGKSTLSGWGNSDDERAMRKAIQTLGASIKIVSEHKIEIVGIARFPSVETISAGESGLGIRLLTPVCAAHSGKFTITGEGSLPTRPMDFFVENLPQFGATCQSNGGKTPLVVSGPMKGSTTTVDGSLSSQFISGLLMATPLATGDTNLSVSDLKSGAYVEMTLQTLKSFGIEITRNAELSEFSIKGNQSYQPTSYEIDADWSSASYWLVAAALGHDIQLKGLRMDSLQADKALLGFLDSANCTVTISDHQIEVDGSQRTPFEVDATDCPDLFPALATLAVFCNGKTVIKGAKRLEHKESHRGLTLQEEFGKLGVRIDLIDDEMHIFGTGKLSGGTVSAHHDHRIAMCLGIAGFNADEPICIQGADAVGKSYPDFWEAISSLNG